MKRRGSSTPLRGSLILLVSFVLDIACLAGAMGSILLLFGNTRHQSGIYSNRVCMYFSRSVEIACINEARSK